jgi:hypothetical protein
VRIVDMSASNSWAELAGVFCQTRAAFLDHEQAKTELKILMPEDAKEAKNELRKSMEKPYFSMLPLINNQWINFAPH